VIVDTTVQPKAIAFPTDAKLLARAREHLVMSTTMIDDFAAIRFAFGQLDGALHGSSLYEDHVVLFELGGDSKIVYQSWQTLDSKPFLEPP
jgi:hypothetical protein